MKRMIYIWDNKADEEEYYEYELPSYMTLSEAENGISLCHPNWYRLEVIITNE